MSPFSRDCSIVSFGAFLFLYMKASPKVQAIRTDDEAATRAALVDEFGELDRQVKAFSETAKRHESLRKTIVAWFPNLPGDQAAIISGQLYQVNVGMREEKRSILSMVKVFKAVGKTKFLEACSFTIDALETALGKVPAEAFLDRSRTGARKVTAVLNAPAQPAAAA